MLKYWIWLAERSNVSDEQKVALLEHFLTPEEIYSADRFDMVEGLTEKGLESLRSRDLTEATAILARCRKGEISLLTYGDRTYPQRLREISDPPMVLYYKGTLPDFDRLPVIGVVGTRRASGYGLQTAALLGGQIAACGGLVVSGMAEGIDAKATGGALSAGKPAVGVLGCGVDRVYPASNRPLYENMYRYGCLISEFSPGTPPQKWNFPKRNRIISGLSCGILVVEAPERSGALITARLALEQQRDVFVVPGNLGVESCMGSNALLREGALMVASGWDVVSEYQYLFPNVIERRDYAPKPEEVPETPVFQQKPKEIPVASAPKPKTERSLNALTEELTPVQRAIAEHLREGERLIDDLILETGMEPGELLGELTMMEICGLIQTLPGRRVALL